MSDTPTNIEWGAEPTQAAPTNAQQIADLTQVVASLAQVAQDHEQYREDVNEFQLWLKAVVEKVREVCGA